MPIVRIKPYPRGFGKKETKRKRRYVYLVLRPDSSIYSVYSSKHKAEQYIKDTFPNYFTISKRLVE